MSMQPFVYNSQASRVVFGVGSLSYLTREIEALGARRALVLSTPEQRRSAEQVAELIGEHCERHSATDGLSGRFDQVKTAYPLCRCDGFR
jgi:alcohol dehydrogenase class IV